MTPKDWAQQRFMLLRQLPVMMIELPQAAGAAPTYMISAMVTEANGDTYHFPIGQLFSTPFADEPEANDKDHAAPGSVD